MHSFITLAPPRPGESVKVNDLYFAIEHPVMHLLFETPFVPLVIAAALCGLVMYLSTESYFREMYYRAKFRQRQRELIRERMVHPLPTFAAIPARTRPATSLAFERRLAVDQRITARRHGEHRRARERRLELGQTLAADQRSGIDSRANSDRRAIALDRRAGLDRRLAV